MNNSPDDNKRQKGIYLNYNCLSYGCQVKATHIKLEGGGFHLWDVI